MTSSFAPEVAQKIRSSLLGGQNPTIPSPTFPPIFGGFKRLFTISCAEKCANLLSRSVKLVCFVLLKCTRV